MSGNALSTALRQSAEFAGATIVMPAWSPPAAGGGAAPPLAEKNTSSATRSTPFYLDLEEVDTRRSATPGPLGQRPRPFRLPAAATTSGDAALPLAESVRRLVAALRLGTRPEGPIRLLTNLACLGTNFNPVSFYYCYRERRRGARRRWWPTSSTHRGASATPTSSTARRPKTASAPLRHPLRVRAATRSSTCRPFSRMAQQYAWKFLRPGRKRLLNMENFEKAGPRSSTPPYASSAAPSLSPRALLA